MRAVFQRVKKAGVSVDGEEIAVIGPGALILVAVSKDDTGLDVSYMADKLSGLRVFPDCQGKMNRSILDVKGEVLLVPQFTLYGDVKKGKRPGFDRAADPEKGQRLFMDLCRAMENMNITVKTGRFGAHMEVYLLNDGPVTILVSSSKEF